MSLYIYSQPKLNQTEMSYAFCNLYYSNVHTKGLSAVLHLFDISAKCNINGSEHVGMHNILVKFAEANISKMSYDKLSCNSQIIDNSLLIQVTGLTQYITFSNSFTNIVPFSEIFILKPVNNTSTFHVTNYIYKLI